MKKRVYSLALVAAAFVLALCVGCSSSASSSASSSSASASASSSASSSASASTSSSASSSSNSASASSSAATSSTPAVAVAENGTVADGSYTVEVKLGGGTGRATVESPAALKVENGTMTMTLVWSSSNYDKMVVGGQQYLPVNSGGNSTFEIPVASLNEPLSVQAETTAMSEPHMIDYTLTFDSSTVK